MKKIYPSKLKKRDEIRVIAPSGSLSIVDKKIILIATERFEKDLDVNITFGKNVNNIERFDSASVKDRVEDFNDAFSDTDVRAIIALRGGYNCNQLLEYIDWENVKKNPKIFCGFSDITALTNAIFATTGVVTYSGPNFTSFGQKLYFDFTLQYFQNCLKNDDPIPVSPSTNWFDDKWKVDQNNRFPIQNTSFLKINDGTGMGTIIGGNLCTFNLLQGTRYFPSLEDTILFIEDDDLPNQFTLLEFERNLQSLLQQPNSNKIQGIIVGRFQRASTVKNEDLISMLRSKRELSAIPIIANVDFGHTDPKITFPIGGVAKIESSYNGVKIEILEH